MSYHRLSTQEPLDTIATETSPEVNPDADVIDFSIDPFVPLVGHYDAPTQNIVTIRAVVTGSICGALVNASNIYLGLRVGWTSSANILGAIVGFVVLKKWSAGSQHVFGVHENNIAQTVATASGGLSNIFISAFPALYQLGLLKTPAEDFLRLVTITAVGGYFGLLSVVPLRKFFIEQVARELSMIFPSSMATAITIKNMHSTADRSELAGRKLKATIYAFLAAMAIRILSQYALGILWDWHVFTWFSGVNALHDIAVAAESWGWVIEWSPAMIGSGMLVDFNVAASFLAGSVLAWGIIGPYLVSSGIASGDHISSAPGWTDLMSYRAMSVEYASPTHLSPRYWLLWPGVACTLTVALVELACQWRIFWRLILVATRNLKTMSKVMQRHILPRPYHLIQEEVTDDEKELEARPNDMTSHTADIPTWMWAPGLVILVALTGVVAKLQFGMSPFEAIFALFLAFCMSLVAIQATGATDTTPLNAISKVSQVILSSSSKAAGGSITDAQRLNLLGASLTNAGASQAVDLVGDFRVGFLLRTPPRPQYIAQLLGTFVATLVAPAVFVLFAKAYPCIIASQEAQDATDECEFPAPTVAAWKAVAIAASEPTSPIPPTSIQFSLVFAGIAVVFILVRNFVLRGKMEFLRGYQPNMMILALAFTLPSPQAAISMMLGALLAKVWGAKKAESLEHFGSGVAAGLIAGEGFGGTINCVLSIIGIGGRSWSTGIGCPAGQC